MDFAREQRSLSRHLPGIAFVIVLHIFVIWGLATMGINVGLIPKGSLDAVLMEDFKKPPPDTPPPPPPKFVPPPDFIPPPDINIQVQAPATNVISNVTREAPKKEPVRRSAVIDAKRNCSMPEYPAASRRLEERGTVILSFLIDVDGRVLDSKVQQTSGYERLDEAAREALSRCRFKPATVDNVPEQSWSAIKYTWKLQ